MCNGLLECDEAGYCYRPIASCPDRTLVVPPVAGASWPTLPG